MRQAWPTREAYEANGSLKEAWQRLCDLARNKLQGRVPANLTSVEIETITSLLESLS